MVESGSTLRTGSIVFIAAVGIAIVATELIGGVPPLGSTASMIVMTTLAVPLTSSCYRAFLSVRASTATQTDEGDEMSAEEVKQKTERISEEPQGHIAFPPGQGPGETPSSSGSTRSTPIAGVDSGSSNHGSAASNDRDSGSDSSGMEFNWQSETDVDFTDIGGMADLKEELRVEVIKPLENPEKAEDLGVSAPNIIFHGPPGTGKTYTAEALATELGLPFAQLSGADVQSKWINESASKVNNLFSEAREMAAREGGAVVFLDELDSVLKNRSGSGGSHEEDNKVVNEFLNHLEDTKDHNIVFIGATNRLDALDDAGIRSGRIDLKIHVGKPDVEAREEILRAQLNDREHDVPEAGIEELAAATDGAVAADLELLVNRAAKNVLTRDGEAILWSDFVESFRD